MRRIAAFVLIGAMVSASCSPSSQTAAPAASTTPAADTTVEEGKQLSALAPANIANQPAQNQGAMLWEVRAATTLAQLWRDQGKRADARDLLAPIYHCFTEGFDTRDLKEAATLLAELA